MFQRSGDTDSICALSTPSGHGGIAVIRLSGPQAFAIATKLCPFLPEKPETHKIYFGIARDMRAEPMDEVLVSTFHNGRSFTGEETAEISCHGSPALAAQILSELVSAGARTARPGEFTYRAFMNGKLDLVQAESVLSLIESDSKQASRMALRQLQGELSKDYLKIEDGLSWILAQLEAGIDFSTEGLDVVDYPKLEQRARDLMSRCEKLISSYQQGQVIKSGLVVALVGEPNVGKSSLLNALTGEERAIVNDQPGTTRDLVEGQISIGGVKVTFVDTAGLRETSNVVEKIGIERTHRAMTGADVVLHVYEPKSELSRWAKQPSERVQNTYALLNKTDLLKPSEIEQAKATLAKHAVTEVLPVSAQDGDGLERLRDILRTLIQRDVMSSASVVGQARHVELLKKIHTCLLKALTLINEHASSEFVAFELQDAIRAIHELLGKEFDEQVIDRIFKEFCLGK